MFGVFRKQKKSVDPPPPPPQRTNGHHHLQQPQGSCLNRPLPPVPAVSTYTGSSQPYYTGGSGEPYCPAPPPQYRNNFTTSGQFNQQPSAAYTNGAPHHQPSAAYTNGAPHHQPSAGYTNGAPHNYQQQQPYTNGYNGYNNGNSRHQEAPPPSLFYEQNTGTMYHQHRPPVHPNQSYRSTASSNATSGGPPPVKSKWVDLDDPSKKVRTRGRSRRPAPNVIRSHSSGSVQSANSVNSAYSTRSEQFKNSVRIPDTKFGATWTSSESMSRNRAREWNVDTGRKHKDNNNHLLGVPTNNGHHGNHGNHVQRMNSDLSSLKSSCGNVSSDQYNNRSVGSPPPAYPEVGGMVGSNG
eukprot:sb/3466189/